MEEELKDGMEPSLEKTETDAAEKTLQDFLANLPDSYFTAVKITDDQIVETCESVIRFIRDLKEKTSLSTDLKISLAYAQLAEEYLWSERVDLTCTWGRAATQHAIAHLRKVTQEEE